MLSIPSRKFKLFKSRDIRSFTNHVVMNQVGYILSATLYEDLLLDISPYTRDMIDGITRSQVEESIRGEFE